MLFFQFIITLCFIYLLFDLYYKYIDRIAFLVNRDRAIVRDRTIIC